MTVSDYIWRARFAELRQELEAHGGKNNHGCRVFVGLSKLVAFQPCVPESISEFVPFFDPQSAAR